MWLVAAMFLENLYIDPGDLPDSGIKPLSLASPALAGGFFTTEPPGKPHICPMHVAK